MNKGCVVEIRKNTMVIMTEDCLFTEVKKKGQAEIGAEIQFHSTEIVKPKRGQIQPWMLMAASILLVVITSLYGVNLWQMNYQVHALLTVDINPSIQMEVNANNKVIKVTPLNEDAKTLPLQELKNQSVEQALEELVKISKEQGYLYFGEENYILVGKVLLKENKTNLTDLQTMIEAGKERIEQTAMEQGEKISVVTIEAEAESLAEAKKDNVSVGKLKIYEKIQAGTSEDLDIEEMKQRNIGEMMKQIEKDHPVFEQHPRTRNQEEKGSEHPSNQKKTDEQEQPKEHPVFNEHPSNKEKEQQKQEKQHPVFEQNPSNQDKEESSKSHPVFDEHPSNQKKDNEEEQLNKKNNQGENNKQDEKVKQNEKEDKKDHPVFDQQQESRSKGRQKPEDVLIPAEFKRIYSLTF